MKTQQATSQAQFDPQASAYLTSTVHAAGPDLAFAAERIALLEGARSALDVGCGAGHLAFALAARIPQVVACDPSPSMLATVASAAKERGVAIQTREAAAESLPFADGAFDVVATRYSAHHWLDVPAALREMRRVLKPEGLLLVIDLLGEDDPLADTWLQALELLRDPGHVRDRNVAEWAALLTQAGFSIDQTRRFRIRLAFDAWVARMRTPPELVSAIRLMQSRASAQVHAALDLESDGSFSAWTGAFCARIS